MILREPGAVSGEGAAGAIPGGSSLWVPRTGTPSDPSYSRSGNRRSRIRAPIPLRLPQGVAPLGLHRKPIAVPQQCVPEIDPAALVRDLIPVVVIPGLEIRIVHRFAVLVRGEDGDAVELALGAVDRPAPAAPAEGVEIRHVRHHGEGHPWPLRPHRGPVVPGTPLVCVQQLVRHAPWGGDHVLRVVAEVVEPGRGPAHHASIWLWLG